ncbi:LOW QUALITY PROTEIN: hypothetical protein ACHAXS_001115 [Conticribra weissflogii]
MDHCLFMLIFDNLLGLKSKQADVTAALLHVTLGDNEKFIVEIPLAVQFKLNYQDPLSQETSLWCQSPCDFWKYLTEKLGNCGLPQAPFDTFLFIGKTALSSLMLMM